MSLWLSTYKENPHAANSCFVRQWHSHMQPNSWKWDSRNLTKFSERNILRRTTQHDCKKPETISKQSVGWITKQMAEFNNLLSTAIANKLLIGNRISNLDIGQSHQILYIVLSLFCTVAANLCHFFFSQFFSNFLLKLEITYLIIISTLFCCA